MRSTSCAPAMAMRTTSERPERVRPSEGSTRPTTGRDHASPSTSIGSESPGARPAPSATGADSTTPTREAMIEDTSSPLSPPAT